VHVSAASGVEIMVVDDHPSNVLLLQEMLLRKGYAVRPFLRGREALESASLTPPDLILLDINMPELNGYETCKLLKQNPSLASIPVIFLSAVSQTAGKMEAFRCGGVDYISKPFECEEVHARVDTHLRIAFLQNRLRDQNLNLEAIVEERTRELAKAHAQLSMLDHAKSDFLHMICHELRTPLNGLLGAADLILSETESAAAPELTAILSESQQRVLSLVDSALLLTQIEVEGGKFQAETVHLCDVLTRAAGRAAVLAIPRGLQIDIVPGDYGYTTGNRDLLVTAWRALLETALRFCSPHDSVTVSSRQQAEELVVTVETPSGAIPVAALPCFFHLFAVNEANSGAGDLGLEPAMAKRILFLWGQSVEVENRSPRGIRISVRCPRSAGV
jgi:DNA-binding response OmpR family regulator